MSRLFNTIRFRLYASLGLLAAMLVVVTYFNMGVNAETERALHALDVVSLQRSDAYLLASQARRLMAAETEADQQGIKQLIQDTMARFERIQAGLRAGDEELGLVPVRSAELFPLLDALDEQWAQYRETLETFAAADEETRLELLPRIETQSVAVFTYADRIVNGMHELLDQQVYTARQVSIIVAVVSTAAQLFAIYVIAQTTNSIQGLANAAQAFAAGNLKARANERTLDEIARTSAVFNEMGGRIEQLVRDLEERIEEARAAQARAERSDQVKSAFLASMSHELRTPLNAVINFTRFVVDGDTGPVNEQQVELLTDVINSGKHLLNLINDVLDMSKIEAGSLNLFVEDNIDLNQLLKQAIATGQSLIADKPIRLETSIDAPLPPMRGDRQRILQILLNIMSNACKFTERGEIKLTAYQKDGNVLISISDTGPGIAPDDQAAVFEAFRQTRTGLRSGGGTGLGMPISKNLAEAHGGRLWLESEPGKGTTVYVTLPIKSDILEPLMV